MKKIRIILIALILIAGICVGNYAYAATRSIGAQEKRPFTNKEYKYRVNGATEGNSLLYTIVKLYDSQDKNDSNELLYNKALYCLRGGVGFGANDEQDVSNAPIEYTEYGEMHTNARAMIQKYNELYSVNLDRTETIDEKEVNVYNAILWILDEAYLPKNATNYNEAEYKSDLLAKAGIYDPNNEVSKDDIEVIQQLAIWYFANFDQQLGKKADPAIITPSRATKFPAQFLSVDGNNDLANYRKLDKLFQYFINGALEYSSNYTLNADGARTKVIEKNEFNKENSKLTMESVDKGYKRPGVYVLTDYYYVVGPFSFVEGSENAKVDPNDIILYDKNGNAIKKIYYYEKEVEGQKKTGKDTVYAFYNESKATIENGKVTALTGEPDTEITKGTDYYIKFYKIYDKDFTTGDDEADENFDYIPEDEKYDISKISLKVLSSYSLSTATVLTRTNQDQVLVEINKQKVQEEDELTVEKPKYFDLSLRKFIASINGVSPATSRVPRINTNSLINGRLNWKGTREYTATYSHPKDALPVERGNRVIYTLRVYNEGDIDGTATEVTDYIPSGLQFAQNSEINTRYGWTVSEDGRKATTNYLKNTTIKAFDVGKTTIEAGWQKAETGLGGLYYADLQIECEVIANPTDANPDLRNIAAITEDNGDDRDSNIDGNEPNINDYNPTEDNSTYQEDDDDYEPLKLKAPVFDLALRKYITKVETADGTVKTIANPRDLNNIDTNRLNSIDSATGEKITTADYMHRKDPVEVEPGDMVTYRFVTYNEGDIAGYVQSITDNLPTWLWFEPTEEFVSREELQKYNEIVNLTELSSEQQILKNKVENAKYIYIYNEENKPDGHKILTIKSAYYALHENYDGVADALWGLQPYDGKNLDSKYLEVKFKVSENFVSEADTYLTNVATMGYGAQTFPGDIDSTILDRDSSENIITIPEQNVLVSESETAYKGNNNNKNELNDANYHYAGQEDDDDFEKIVVKSKKFDLALRKYITAVERDGENVTISNARNLNNIDSTLLQTETTADYKHIKSPVEVKPGDKVTYTFRVYNEGDIEGKVTSITDYLPKGLKLDTTGLTKVENEDANIEIWTKSDNIPTDAMTGLFTDVIYTFNKTARTLTIKYETNGEPSNMFGLDPFNASHADESSSSTVTRKEGWIKGLNYGETSVKLIVDPEEVEVTSKDMILTNVATMEYASVGETRLPDRDSNRGGEDHLQVEFNVPEQSKLVSSDETAYKGLDSNPDNLTSEVHFKGQQDDDDFEKIIIKGRNFDLALRKYIDSVNGEKESPSREPQIDTSKLNTIDETTGKKITTATYKHTKDPITVKKGDIVTYKIRIYNEGERDGYATKVTDYLPDGLGFLYTSDGTINSNWFIPNNIETNKLYGENGIYSSENEILKKDAYKKVFGENVDLSKIEVIQAKKKDDDTRDLLEITAGGTVNQTNIKATGLIKAYGSQKESTDLWQQSTNSENDGLFYQELEIVCVVLKENTYLGTLKNVAEITGAEDSEGNEIKLPGDDRDSEPGNVYEDSKHTPGTEVNGYTPGEQDDDDFEPLVLKCFDLALRKFITNVESAGVSQDVTSRIPVPKMNAEGKITYEHTKEPVDVANTDIVTYTIRVFNEGTVAGYAEEVTDDLPEGLIFLPNNEINKQYEWKMIDKDGKETQNVDEAVKVTTDYLSSAKETENRKNIINPFDASTGITEQNPDYKDVKIAFRVIEPNTSDRILVNSAQISKDSDDDIDSIPDKWREEDDDQDREYVKVRYFDLSLLKWVTQSIVTVDGKTTTTNTGFNPNTGKTETTGIRDNSAAEPIAKVEVDKKKLDRTVVKFAYKIRVTNEGTLEGYATEITDIIPEGLEFYSEDNKAFGWEQKGDGLVTTRALETTLLKPGEFAELTIIFRWKNNANNLGLKTNVAHITEDYNKYNSKDIDSIPDNLLKPYEKEQEDDDDFALVMLSLMTGKTAEYTLFGVAMVAMLAGGLYLIKKKVLDY